MGLGGVAIAVPPYVIHPKTVVLGRAGGRGKNDSGYRWMEIASSQLRIIIRQEYRQKYRHCKETSHADNQELTKVLTSVQSLYPIKGIYISEDRKHGKLFLAILQLIYTINNYLL